MIVSDETYAENKQNLPIRNRGGMDMLEAIGDAGPDNLRDSNLHVPESRTTRLFGFCPPHPGDQNQGGGHGGLEHTEEKSNNH